MSPVIPASAASPVAAFRTRRMKRFIHGRADRGRIPPA